MENIYLKATVPPFFQCIGHENVGQPIPQSYCEDESNNFPSQLTQQNIPASFTLTRSLLNAGSVPTFNRVIRNASGDRILFQSPIANSDGLDLAFSCSSSSVRSKNICVCYVNS